jgi:hypothetical protein
MTMADAEFSRGVAKKHVWASGGITPGSGGAHNLSPTILFSCVEQNAFQFREVQRSAEVIISPTYLLDPATGLRAPTLHVAVSGT